MFLVISVLIRIDSPGPIFYRAKRVGKDVRLFRLYKFRSMFTDADKVGPAITVAGDTRVTRIGHFLRQYKLDEFPQLIDVLKGDMSLVGPRPERPVFIEQFRQEIPGYMLRHKVKAGLTGWAQVHGWRGQTSLHERVEHDIYYIENWSVFFDAYILARTPLALLKTENAY